MEGAPEKRKKKLEDDGLQERAKRQANVATRLRVAALESQNRFDKTTGLENRTSYDRYLEGLQRKIDQEGVGVAFIVIDIDHFKAVNDTYGHAAGDRILESVAVKIMETVRAGDRVFRYGGEEIVIVCEGLSLEKATERAEEIREAVRGTEVEYKAETLSVTVSIGVTAIDEGEDASVQDLFSNADRAMYEAKEGGRDRVVAEDFRQILEKAA